MTGAFAAGMESVIVQVVGVMWRERFTRDITERRDVCRRITRSARPVQAYLGTSPS